MSQHPRPGEHLACIIMEQRALSMPVTDQGWMKTVADAASTLKAQSVGARAARHHVYVVLLHDPSRRDPWGVYVGQTSLDPDERFDQHKTGYKASRAARRFGVRLLPAIVAHLNPHAGWESLDLEAALADRMRAAGITWVEGGH